MKPPQILALVLLLTSQIAIITYWCMAKLAINFHFNDEHAKTTIFFIETKTAKLHFSARESCSIESASIRHPNAIVTAYNVNGNFDASNKYIQLLSNMPNINLQFLDATEAFSATPLEDWHRKNMIGTSRYPTEHLSDALRLAILYKNGGIYADSDVIVLKQLDHLRNTLGDSGFNSVETSVLIMDEGSALMYEYMTRLGVHFVGDKYLQEGLNTLDSMVKSWCNNVASYEGVYYQQHKCKGLTVLPPTAFQPMLSRSFDGLFSREFEVDLNGSYVMHLARFYTVQFKAKVGDGTFIERIFEKYCPATFRLIRSDVVF